MIAGRGAPRSINLLLFLLRPIPPSPLLVARTRAAALREPWTVRVARSNIMR